MTNWMRYEMKPKITSAFRPVSTLADLETLDSNDIVAGYSTTERGDPEPGENRGRAFWHGWRNRMMDFGEIEHDTAALQLAHEFVERERRKSR